MTALRRRAEVRGLNGMVGATATLRGKGHAPGRRAFREVGVPADFTPYTDTMPADGMPQEMVKPEALRPQRCGPQGATGQPPGQGKRE